MKSRRNKYMWHTFCKEFLISSIISSFLSYIIHFFSVKCACFNLAWIWDKDGGIGDTNGIWIFSPSTYRRIYWSWLIQIWSPRGKRRCSSLVYIKIASQKSHDIVIESKKKRRACCGQVFRVSAAKVYASKNLHFARSPHEVTIWHLIFA